MTVESDPARAGANRATFSEAEALEAYRRMLRIRRFDETGLKLYKGGRIPGAYHASIGHEAAIVGACMALRDDDGMTGTHRSHGHPIGKGGDLKRLMAELMGKDTGICRGRGGSMHLADNSVGIIGESAIVGGGIPLATCAGMSAVVLGTGRVSLCFFGDGAVNEGTFHECLNMASLWKLPVIYVCENNGYAVSTTLAQSHAQTDISRRADGYGMPGVAVDGQDVAAVYAVAAQAVARARAGEGPTLIEARTYRFDEHATGLVNPGTPYRTKEEIAHWKENRDPVALFKAALLAVGRSEADLAGVEAGVAEAVAEAVKFAEESPAPDPASLYDFMFSEPIGYPTVRRGERV
jgi:TPP-dependent pyruvate/acetoin dehydrogenase alpha subunit